MSSALDFSNDNGTKMIDWNKCKDHFRVDGSLRDIYITPATIADWREIYMLTCNYPGVEYLVDGISHPLPDSVELVFAVRHLSAPMLRFKSGHALFVFHFFSAYEVECDITPSEITSQSDLDVLLETIRQFGNAVHKRVLITPENFRDRPFIIYDPGTRTFELRDAVQLPGVQPPDGVAAQAEII